MLAPGTISKKFEVKNIKEDTSTITIYFEEKTNLIPAAIEEKGVVMNGFLNPIDLQTFPLKDKHVYLSLRRRRWKERGESKKKL